jgi:putative membrane protein
MIAYNPKAWFSIVFKFHKADTFRELLPLILVIAAYSGLIAWLEMSVWQLSQNSAVKNLSLIHSTLGLVISMLLVFRTNTAYERWWEGRKLWGSLVNSSRNFALKLAALAPAEREFFRKMIPAFAVALKHHLRAERPVLDLGADTEDLLGANHVPIRIAGKMIGRVAELEKSGALKPEHVLFLQQELINFADVSGACERIRKTPIPFSYSVFLKKFIFLYVMTLPFGYVFSLGYLVIPVVAIVFYVLASLELIAEEIEDPFGKDANDLPLDDIAATIRANVDEILAK